MSKEEHPAQTRRHARLQQVLVELDAAVRDVERLAEPSGERGPLARVRAAVARGRRALARRIAGGALTIGPEIEAEAIAEVSDALKDIRYQRGRAAWLHSEHAIGEITERPNVPLRFVLLDASGLAHGPFRAELVVRSPLPGNPWVVASPDSESVFRVVAHDREGSELWTEDDERLRVVPLAE